MAVGELDRRFSHCIQSGSSELDLRGVDLSGDRSLVAMRRVFDELPNLIALDLSRSIFDDNGIRALARAARSGHCQTLQSISFGTTSITDVGFTDFARAIAQGAFCNLTTLRLGGCELLSDTSLVRLARAAQYGHLRQLREIDCQSVRITDVGLKALVRESKKHMLPSLSILGLGSTRVTDAGLNRTVNGGITSLQELEIDFAPITDHGLRSMAVAAKKGHLPDFQAFAFGSVSTTDFGLSSLSSAAASGHFKKLRRFRIRHSSINDAGLRTFSQAIATGNLQSLEELEFHGIRISDRGFKELVVAMAVGNLPNLRKLQLHYISVTDQAILALADVVAAGNLESLRKLSLAGTELTDSGLDRLIVAAESGRFQQLQELDVRYTQLTNYGLRVLAAAVESGAFPNLDRLFVKCKRVLIDQTVLNSASARDILAWIRRESGIEIAPCQPAERQPSQNRSQAATIDAIVGSTVDGVTPSSSADVARLTREEHDAQFKPSLPPAPISQEQTPSALDLARRYLIERSGSLLVSDEDIYLWYRGIDARRFQIPLKLLWLIGILDYKALAARGLMRGPGTLALLLNELSECKRLDYFSPSENAIRDDLNEWPKAFFPSFFPPEEWVPLADDRSDSSARVGTFYVKGFQGKKERSAWTAAALRGWHYVDQAYTLDRKTHPTLLPPVSDKELTSLLKAARKRLREIRQNRSS